MTAIGLDRPAAIRKALRDLVAEHGFHGASMSAVARAAGVATGTAYVHYDSKEELIYATYLEIKRDLGEDVLSKLDSNATPDERYAQLWRATFEHMATEPRRARFLTQLEESPFHEVALQRLKEQGDPVAEIAADPALVEKLVPLPPELLYSLSIGVAVRLAASGAKVDDEQLQTLIQSTWRAITRG